MPPPNANITLGTLDLTSKIINVGHLNLKWDSEIIFSYKVPTYSGPGYSVPVSLPEPGRPMVHIEVVPGAGGIINITQGQTLNTTILFTNWAQIGSDSSLQVTLGSQAQNVNYGQSSVTFNGISGDSASFSIIINNQFGANTVKGLLPLKINWNVPAPVATGS